MLTRASEQSVPIRIIYNNMIVLVTTSSIRYLNLI